MGVYMALIFGAAVDRGLKFSGGAPSLEEGLLLLPAQHDSYPFVNPKLGMLQKLLYDFVQGHEASACLPSLSLTRTIISFQQTAEWPEHAISVALKKDNLSCTLGQEGSAWGVPASLSCQAFGSPCCSLAHQCRHVCRTHRVT